MPKANNPSAVMLISQGDPGFDASDPTRAALRDPRALVDSDTQPDGFHDFLVAVRTAVIDFAHQSSTWMATHITSA
jgi:hypothetical protein